MAKELPYFKFEPNEWENGNIQLCSRESKGLFIDICTTYWSRLGDMPYALALQKHCNGNNDALQELLKYEILEVEKDNIYIKFLDEQLSEFSDISEKRRKSANLRWKKANAMQVHSKSNAIREEEKREEKKKEEVYNPKNSLLEYGFEKQLVNDYLKIRKDKKATLTKTAFDNLISEIEKTGKDKNEVLKLIVVKNWLSFKASWDISESFPQEQQRKITHL